MYSPLVGDLLMAAGFLALTLTFYLQMTLLTRKPREPISALWFWGERHD